jgi:3-hydroxybutyrate dehydrogenase
VHSIAQYGSNDPEKAQGDFPLTGAGIRPYCQSPDVTSSLKPGSVAVVTGAGRGIGRAIALAMARHGARVVVASRPGPAPDEVVAAIAAAGGEAVTVACDVTSAVSVTAAFAEARQRLGPIDILVNNAGVAGSAPVLKIDEDEWARTIAVNLTGTFRCTQAALPDMIARGRGRIINIASVAGRVGYAYTAAYCAAKHGVLGFTRAVALEVARKGVTINAICPGWVDTDMTTASIARIVKATGRTAGQAREAIEAMNPQRRLIRPEEVAAVAVFLAGEDAHGITGQAIDVDGGEVMA